MAADIQIRRCVVGDEEALSLIGRATFLETFAGVLGGRDIIAHCATSHTAETYRCWLADPSYQLWIAEINPGNAPVGFVVVAPAQLPLPDISGLDLEIKRLYLLHPFQGGGMGKRMISAAKEHAHSCQANRLLLGVYAHNESAISFYERAGFQKLGERKFNVGGQDYDDHIMGLFL